VTRLHTTSRGKGRANSAFEVPELAGVDLQVRPGFFEGGGDHLPVDERRVGQHHPELYLIVSCASAETLPALSMYCTYTVFVPDPLLSCHVLVVA
jgi:hypothetical protein